MRLIALLMAAFILSGCSSLKFWESDEADELAPAELVDVDNQVDFEKLWSRGIGGGQDELYSSLKPAFADGIVYGADPDGDVVAIDAEKGRVLWKQDLDHDLSGGVGVGGGLVILTDLEGRVFALNAGTGEVNWQVRIGNELMSAPASNGDIVAVQSLDGFLIGLNASDGQERWRYRVDIPSLTLRSATSPVIKSTTLIAGFASGKVVALNPANGNLLWESRVAVPKGRTELERMVDIAGSPVLVDDVCYVTSFQGRAAALSRGTGRTLWYQDVSSYWQPGVGGDNIYVTQTNDEIKALRANSGQVMWTNEQMKYRQLTSPAYVGGYVAVGDADGYLHILSATDGSYLGRRRVDSSGLKMPFISDGKILYVLDNDGDITAFKISPR